MSHLFYKEPAKKKKKLTVNAIIHIANIVENFIRGKALLYWEFLG